MLSHELRNPLAPIRNARRDDPPPRAARAEARPGPRDVIERQVAHLTRLVDDLLDVSRISQGKIALQTEPLDLRARRRAGDRDRAAVHRQPRATSCTTTAARRAGRGCAATSRACRRCVANLLNNAAKYTDDGGRIELALTLRAGPGA